MSGKVFFQSVRIVLGMVVHFGQCGESHDVGGNVLGRIDGVDIAFRAAEHIYVVAAIDVQGDVAVERCQVGAAVEIVAVRVARVGGVVTLTLKVGHHVAEEGGLVTAVEHFQDEFRTGGALGDVEFDVAYIAIGVAAAEDLGDQAGGDVGLCCAHDGGGACLAVTTAKGPVDAAAIDDDVGVLCRGFVGASKHVLDGVLIASIDVDGSFFH